MNRQKMQLAGLVMAMGLSGATHAALESRLDGLAVYDTDLNITWLANANLAANNTFGMSGIDQTGLMSWDTAQTWIGAMNTANYLGYNNWMLPTTLQPDASCGFQSGGSNGPGCTGSQMGHLFYSELGGEAGSDITTSHNASFNLFNNVQADAYWSGTEYAPDQSNAWLFGMYGGVQGYGPKFLPYARSLALLPGDVALTCTDASCASVMAAVPEPESWGLMLSGLCLVGWAARSRKVQRRLNKKLTQGE